MGKVCHDRLCSGEAACRLVLAPASPSAPGLANASGSWLDADRPAASARDSWLASLDARAALPASAPACAVWRSPRLESEGGRRSEGGAVRVEVGAAAAAVAGAAPRNASYKALQ